MKQIALEDIATVFASEFVKHTTFLKTSGYCPNTRMMYKDFLKMNYSARKRVVEEVIDKLMR